MSLRRKRTAKDQAQRRAWLADAEKWNGAAHVFNPHLRRYEPVEAYKAAICCPMMAWFDRLPMWERRRIANSADGE